MRSMALMKVPWLKWSLPLNIRCSNRWAKPVVPVFLFFEPTWYQVLTATTGVLWSSWTSTVRPFFSTNLVYGISGMAISDLTDLAGSAACSVPPADNRAIEAARMVRRMDRVMRNLLGGGRRAAKKSAPALKRVRKHSIAFWLNWRLFALGRAGVAGGAEFCVLGPVRPGAGVGQVAAQSVQQAEVVRHAGERPGCAPLVRRLVVVVAVVVLFRLVAGRLAAVDPVVAGAEGNRRHAALREREVVGAEEVARFRLRIGGVRHVHLLGLGDQLVQQVQLGAAGDGEVARRAVRAERVHIDHAGRLGQRIQRIGGVVLGAEQALLLRRHRQ